MKSFISETDAQAANATEKVHYLRRHGNRVALGRAVVDENRQSETCFVWGAAFNQPIPVWYHAKWTAKHEIVEEHNAVAAPAIAQNANGARGQVMTWIDIDTLQSGQSRTFPDRLKKAAETVTYNGTAAGPIAIALNSSQKRSAHP